MYFVDFFLLCVLFILDVFVCISLFFFLFSSFVRFYSFFFFFVFFFKQKTAYELRICDWSSDVCSSDLLTGQRELDDRHRRGVVVEDQRRRGAGRERLEDRLRDRRHLRVGGGDVDAGLEENLDDAEADQRGRFDVLDVVDRRCQHALIWGRDARRHLIGRQAGVLPGHRDHRDLDRREDVGRRAQVRERSDDQDQQRQDDERVRPGERDSDKALHGVSRGSGGRPVCGAVFSENLDRKSTRLNSSH